MPINRFTDAIKFTQDVIGRLPVCFPLSDILIRFLKSSDADLINSSGEDYASIGTLSTSVVSIFVCNFVSLQNGIQHTETTHGWIPN